MGESYDIKVREYPGNGVLDPRWKDAKYIDRKGKERVSRADVRILVGPSGPEVQPGGGTSLHDVPQWYSAPDFWIPEGTEYADSEIRLHRDDDLRTSPYNPKLSGHHFQLEAKYPMAPTAFAGALNNMARAAIVRQIALSKSGEKSNA